MRIYTQLSSVFVVAFPGCWLKRGGGGLGFPFFCDVVNQGGRRGIKRKGFVVIFLLVPPLSLKILRYSFRKKWVVEDE